MGEDYEPIIYSALNSSKVMLLVGTSRDNMNAPWVRNEWSRFLDMMDADPGTKYLIPVYANMDPYDIPNEITGRRIQAQDATKIGYQQDIISGIHKLISKSRKSVSPVAMTGSGNASAIIERGFICLQDGDFKEAERVFDQALNVDPHAAGAYLGRLMVRRRVRNIEDLGNESKLLSDDKDYRHALEYADPKFKKKIIALADRILDERREVAENAIDRKRASILAEIEKIDEQLDIKEKEFKDVDQTIADNTKILKEGASGKKVERLISWSLWGVAIVLFICRVNYLWTANPGFLGKARSVLLIILTGIVIVILTFIVRPIIFAIVGKYIKLPQTEYVEAQLKIEKANQLKENFPSYYANKTAGRSVWEKQLELLDQSKPVLIDTLSKLESDKIENAILSQNLLTIDSADNLVSKIEEIVEQQQTEPDESKDQEKRDSKQSSTSAAMEGYLQNYQAQIDKLNYELANKDTVIKAFEGEVKEAFFTWMTQKCNAVESHSTYFSEHFGSCRALGIQKGSAILMYDAGAMVHGKVCFAITKDGFYGKPDAGMKAQHYYYQQIAKVKIDYDERNKLIYLNGNIFADFKMLSKKAFREVLDLFNQTYNVLNSPCMTFKDSIKGTVSQE